MPKPYKLHPDDIPPESQEEKAYVNPLWEDSASEPPKTALDDVREQLQQITRKTPSTPVSEKNKVVSEATPTLNKDAINLARRPLTAAERKKRWRDRNGEAAKQKEREYLRSYRAKKKGLQ